MIGAYAKAIAQLSDPRILRVVVMSVILAMAVYAALVALTVWAVNATQVFGLPWAETLADWGTGLGAAVVAALLFPGVVSGLVALWLESVAAAVEDAHYPHLPPARPVPVAEALGAALRLTGVTVAVNLVLLPAYLLLLFAPPLNFALYYGVNGYMLGREYFETVALRRTGPEPARALRRANRGAVWLTGAAAAFLLTIPVVNMIAPVIGTAAMVHVFHKLTGRV